MSSQLQKLSLGQKAGWGLADMGIVVFVIVKQLLVLAFLTNYLGVPIQVAGLLTTLVLIFDMITDPLIGLLSDRTKSRWGRRAPWMFFGALVLVGGMIGLFSVPEGFEYQGNFAWVTAFFVLATIGFTMVAIPYGAMSGEMTQNPKERSSMTAFRMGFASLGILIGGSVIPALAGDTREGFARAVIYISPLIIASIWGSLWATRNTPRIDQPNEQNFGQSLKLVLSNRPFVVLVCLYGIMTLAIALITAGLLFATQFLIMDNGTSALSGLAKGLGIFSMLFAAFVVGSIISQALWVYASAKLGKLGALIMGLTLYVILLCVMYTLMPTTNVTLFAGVFLLAGMTNGSYQQIPWAIYPDLMDKTREQTGQSIEGTFSAVWLFGQKLANALAPAVLSLILGAFAWQETTGGKIDQPAEAIEALRVSITLVPAGILVFAILGLIFVYRPSSED